MFDIDKETINKTLAALEVEHRELDERIALIAADPEFDQLEIRRMKKRKLVIKDSIARLRSKLIPDLDA